MMYCDNKFVETLQSLMDKSNLSVRSTEKLAGLGSSSIYNWTDKGSNPNMASLIKLAKLFNVSIDYLVFGDKGE